MNVTEQKPTREFEKVKLESEFVLTLCSIHLRKIKRLESKEIFLVKVIPASNKDEIGGYDFNLWDQNSYLLSCITMGK